MRTHADHKTQTLFLFILLPQPMLHMGSLMLVSLHCHPGTGSHLLLSTACASAFPCCGFSERAFPVLDRWGKKILQPR